MKIKYAAIIEESEALKAVEQDGYALRYVLDIATFCTVSKKLKIEVEE